MRLIHVKESYSTSKNFIVACMIVPINFCSNYLYRFFFSSNTYSYWQKVACNIRLEKKNAMNHKYVFKFTLIIRTQKNFLIFFRL